MNVQKRRQTPTVLDSEKIYFNIRDIGSQVSNLYSGSKSINKMEIPRQRI